MHSSAILIFVVSLKTIHSYESDNCKRILPNCSCSEKVIDCSEAGFTTTEIFLNIPSNFRELVSLNMSGNKFEFLEMDLFGLRDWQWDTLEILDLSNCQIVGIHEKAFDHLPKLQELILANNLLSFRGRASGVGSSPGHRIWPTENFLRIVSRTVKSLDLSNAFDGEERRKSPQEFVTNLTGLFNETDLKVLQYLNLSSNDITYLPPDTFCRLPVLEYLYLSSNLLHSFSADHDCMLMLMELRLQSNYFRRLDAPLMELIDNRPTLQSVYLADNPFLCDCESQNYIRWIRMTGRVIDKAHMVCTRARPKEYTDKALISVPEDKLRCPNDASEYLHGVYILCAVALVGLIVLLTCIIYTSRRTLCKRSGQGWMPLGGYQTLGREPEVKAEMV